MFTNFIRFLIKNLYSSATSTTSAARSPSNASLLGFALVFNRNDTHAPIFFALLQRSRCFHSHLYNLVAFYALSGLTIVNTIYVIYEAARKFARIGTLTLARWSRCFAIDLETKQKPQKDSSSLLLFESEENLTRCCCWCRWCPVARLSHLRRALKISIFFFSFATHNRQPALEAERMRENIYKHMWNIHSPSRWRLHHEPQRKSFYFISYFTSRFDDA